MSKIKNSTLFIKLRSFYRNEREKKYFNIRTKFYSTFLKKGDLVFDVGANVGNRVEAFLHIKAKVIAIEPQKECRKVLNIKFGNKITIVKEGLGEKEELKTLYIADSNTISSFSKEWIDDVKDDRFAGEKWTKTEQIQLTTLDKLISTYGKPKFIKIDVEGFELMVLKGLNSPIDVISFEYTIPEQIEQVNQCLSYLNNLSANYTYNYSTGESMLLELEEYISYTEFIEVIKTKEFIDSSNGDIYAKIKN
jgi:FkbM family methyltransferase